MASELIGRAPCVLCDFQSAHVKRKTDPAAGKVARPYLHCPGCGVQLFALNDRQAELLQARARPEGKPAPAAAPPASSSVAGKPAPAAKPEPAAKPRRGLSDFIGIG